MAVGMTSLSGEKRISLEVPHLTHYIHLTEDIEGRLSEN
jgi:hypothetical protein